MQRIKQNTSYYINERAVNLVENALGDPSLIQVSLYSGTVVLVYIKGIIDYAYDGGYQRFPLYGYNTALVSNEAHHIYIRIDRSRGTAMLLFSTQEYEFDSDESGQYWYIRCGEVTSAGSGSTPREITFDSGLLSTAEGLEGMLDGRYVSVSYFERIFDVLNESTPLRTNDLNTAFDSLKVKAGLWTEQYVSALGQNSGGGGSGGGSGGSIDRQSLFEDILTGTPDTGEYINPAFIPIDGTTLYIQNGTLKSRGTISSVGLAVPTGFTVSGSPLTANGTITIGLDTGYTIPTSSQLSSFLTQTAAASTYLTKTDAASTYLTKADAASTYLTIAFFNRIFQAHSASGDVNPNDMTTQITNIEALFGFWTEEYISSLGQGSSGGGGGALYLNDILDVTISQDVSDGQVLLYQNGIWVNSQLTSAVTSLGTNGNYLTWTKDGNTNNITIPYATKAQKDADGNIITSTYSTIANTVTALGTNGNYLTWTKNGTTSNITVPYATKALNDASGNTITSTYLNKTTAQAAHAVLIGPVSGSSAAPTFRVLQASDIPDLSSLYVTKSFFESLFELYNGSTKISTNGTIPSSTTNINIKAMFGFWTEKYIASLGQGSGGSGVINLEQLEDVQYTGTPANGQALLYNGSYWTNGTVATSDTKVTQAAAITTNNAYPIILAYSTSTSSLTNTVNKSSTLTYNPSTKALVTGGTINGYTLGASSITASSTNIPTSNAVKTFVEGSYVQKSGDTMTGALTMNDVAVRIKFGGEDSRVRGYAWQNSSGSTVACVYYHNTAQNIILNPLGSSSVYSDAVGKYSLFVGNDKLTYNTYAILHANNYTNYTYSATASRTANTVLAAPNGSAGAATFRALVAADIPDLSSLYVTTTFFESLFELYNNSTKISTNGTLPSNRNNLNIKAMFGFWTEKYIASLGQGSSGSGSSLDWSALTTYDGDSSHYVNAQYIPIGSGLSISGGKIIVSGGGFVTLATPQTISANKTFTANIYMGTSHYIYGVNETNGSMLHHDGNRTVIGSYGATSTLATHLRSKTGHLTVGSNNTASYDVLDSGNAVTQIISLLGSGTGNFTDGTEIFSSYANDEGFTGHPNNLYKRSALKMWNYISGKITADTTLNVASATKLATARTLWGQSFDGTANVSGDITVGNGHIYLNNNKYIYIKDYSGTDKIAMYCSTGNGLIIGNGFSGEGYATLLSGYNVSIRYGTNRTTGIYLSETGNVGIGTTSPAEKLEVSGNVKAQNIVPATDNTYQLGSSDFVWNNIYTKYMNFYTEGATSDDSYTNIYMRTKDTTTSQTAYARIRMYNNHYSSNNGNLLVYSSGNAIFGGGEGVLALSDLVRTDNENTYIAADSVIYFDSNCGANSNDATGRKGFGLSTNGNLLPTVADVWTSDSGQLGTSSYRWNYLYVNNVNASGNILASGDVTALSDIRQKSPISDVNTRIEDVANLPLFYFRWKYKDDENIHIGTSAQAVQKLFPELVLGKEEFSVNYGVLGTTLGILNSRKLTKHEDDIKELKKETKALRKENKALKERIKMLEEQA